MKRTSLHTVVFLVLVLGTTQVLSQTVSCIEDSDCQAFDPGSWCKGSGTCHRMECTEDSHCNPNSFYCDGIQFCDGAWQCQDSAPPCAAEICHETGGGDGYCEDCVEDSDCDDSNWCNGVETCSIGNQCQPGTSPCSGGTQCNESDQTCTVPCVTNAQCDNGIWCDGVEVCNLEGRCLPGAVMCDENSEECDEVDAVCTPKEPQEGISDGSDDGDEATTGDSDEGTIDEYVEYVLDPDNRVVVAAGAGGVLIILILLVVLIVAALRPRTINHYTPHQDNPSAMGDGTSSVRTLTRKEANDHLAVLAQVAEIAKGGSNVNLRGRGGKGLPEINPEDFLPQRRDSDVDVMSSRSATVLVQRLAHNGFELLNAMFHVVGPHELDPMAVATVHIFDYISDIRDLLVGLFAEEVQSSTNGADMMRATAPAARVMSYMFQTYGTEYRHKLLQPIVESIMADPMLTTHAVYKPSEYPAAVAACSSHTANLITSIAGHPDNIPFILRDVLRILKMTVSEKFPARTQSTIADAFFLKFLCPALANPFAHGLVESSVPPHKAGVFVAVSKLANTIAQGGPNPASSKKQPLVEALEIFVKAQATTIANFIAEALPTNLSDDRANHTGHETTPADARKGLDQMRAVLKAYGPDIQTILTNSSKTGSVVLRDVVMLFDELPPKGGVSAESQDDETIQASAEVDTEEISLEDADDTQDRRGSVATEPSLTSDINFAAKRDIAEAHLSMRRFPSNADFKPNGAPAV